MFAGRTQNIEEVAKVTKREKRKSDDESHFADAKGRPDNERSAGKGGGDWRGGG